MVTKPVPPAGGKGKQIGIEGPPIKPFYGGFKPLPKRAVSGPFLPGKRPGPVSDMGPPTRQLIQPYTEDWLEKPGGWHSAQQERLKRQMEKAGLYGGGSGSRSGLWTKQDKDAYRVLLGLANTSRRSATDLLGTLQKDPLTAEEMGQAGGAAAALTPPLTNPDDFRKVAKAAAPDAIGRELNEQELAEYTAAFHQVQVKGSQGQLQANKASEAGGVHPFVAQPNEAAFIEAKLEKEKPQEVAEYDYIQRFGEMDSILKGMGSAGS